MSASQIYFFDTNILIDLYIDPEKTEDVDNREKTNALLASIKKQNAKVAITTDVLAEILVKIPEEDILNFEKNIRKTFMIFPFDQLAAQYCSKIVHNKLGQKKSNERELKNPNNIIDIHIIATAKACGAEKIYTQDKKFISAAEGYIDAENLPTLPITQGQLLN